MRALYWCLVPAACVSKPWFGSTTNKQRANDNDQSDNVIYKEQRTSATRSRPETGYNLLKPRDLFVIYFLSERHTCIYPTTNDVTKRLFPAYAKPNLD